VEYGGDGTWGSCGDLESVVKEPELFPSPFDSGGAWPRKYGYKQT
jgi:hypothetical protein